MEKFITVAVFDYVHEIQILKHRLDQEELQYFFENEIMSSFAPMYSNALGGIKLKIHPNDYETVKTILQEMRYDNNLKIV
ncbi:MAG: DUF2007 domain-containing protein [Flavobacteriaceae bacterium]|jgi:hypothetical protein|uniref:DUF2007 domain-containing protein n=1 Tax=Flavobacterium kayseriense TaxID=2764714 RepID=A0ABR7J4N5_9FLAO|nr:DUF2007 domain-containing protein [Flavobacterium kayseriense]MBC5840510.1 DUF2007 domain-containing protein [Flavobacterium kayseriense]MBC5846820.1 DUF2007 domain-containing protein [Flavobacterium kayseriense]MBU0942505.1 DUF2007 domain-containing protein [Bacteroidota bacterium]MBX9888486.1 DUF2007 domain-containing protein [Flavobacteriaceae bacterium]